MPRPDRKTSLRLMWQKIDADIADHGGWTVSPLYEFPVRFECLPDIVLPKLLRQAGYNVVNVGSAERFLPVSLKAMRARDRSPHAN